MSYLPITSLRSFENNNPHLELKFEFLDNPLNGKNFYCSFRDKDITHEFWTDLSQTELDNKHNLSVFESHVVDNIKRKLAGEPNKWNEETNLYN